MSFFDDPHEALRHHVTGAIERGEAEAITEVRESASKTGGLYTVINQVRQESFQQAFVVPDEQVLGVAIAEHLKWDRDKILEVAAAALEDANFHVEAAEIRDLGGPDVTQEDQV